MKSKLGKIIKWIVILLVVAFVLIQFKRPDHNNPAVVQAQTLEAQTQVPPEVKAILDRSCKDCHSHETRWPFYSQVAPISWQVAEHVADGRRQLNLSTWGDLNAQRKRRKLDEICEQVEEGEMPLDQYLWIHRDAVLSAQDKTTLCAWTRSEQDKLMQSTPAAATSSPSPTPQ